MPYFLKLLLLALAYYLSGRIGLLLAIQPAQATAIWPASGIALAGLLVGGWRLWPAVFLGALGTSLYHPDVIDFQALAIAASIATGATLQAVVGSFLCKRAVVFPTILEEISDVLKTLWYGGVIACLIAASVGTFTLMLVGFVSRDVFLTQWLLWYAGDLLGVIAFAPALILLFNRPLASALTSYNRRWIVGLSLLILFIFVSFLFFLAKQYDEKDRQLAFEKRADVIAENLEHMLDDFHNVLIANERFIASSEHVSSDEFGLFTHRFFDLYPGIHALSWVAAVPLAEREAFVQSIKNQGYPDFRIYDRTKTGETTIAPTRDIYFPVSYVFPYEKNKFAHGYDSYGPDPIAKNIRRERLDFARDNNEAVTTGRIFIIKADNSYGLLAYQPVFKENKNNNGNKKLLGYATAVFIIPELMQTIFKQAKDNDLDFTLYDRSSTDKQFLYDTRTPDHKEYNENKISTEPTSYKKSFQFFGNDFEIIVINSFANTANYNWALWSVLAFGLLFIGLFGIFILSFTARTDLIQKKVDEKTISLKEANDELEEFAYRTSHDLRSPLVSSIGLLDMMSQLVSKDEPKMVKSISIVKNSLTKLEILVADILELTKTKNLEESKVDINIKEIVDQAIEKIMHMDNFSNIKITQEIDAHSECKSQKSRVILIIENLISNSVKYSDKEKSQPFIKISTHHEKGHTVVSIEDNGIGIPREKQKNLFEMFHRFHPKVSFGSGLGLYMIKKSVASIDGIIEYEDTGDGSLFKIYIPLIN